MSKTVLVQQIQLIISTQYNSIWPINRTLSGVTTLDQSGPGGDDNKAVLSISKSTKNYLNLTIRLISIISKALDVGFLPLCQEALVVFYSPSRLNNSVVDSFIFTHCFFFYFSIIFFGSISNIFLRLKTFARFYSIRYAGRLVWFFTTLFLFRSRFYYLMLSHIYIYFSCFLNSFASLVCIPRFLFYILNISLAWSSLICVWVMTTGVTLSLETSLSYHRVQQL